jgi:hypothetical protein
MMAPIRPTELHQRRVPADQGTSCGGRSPQPGHLLTRSHLAGGHRVRRVVVASSMATGLLTGMTSVGGLPRANAAAASPLGHQAPKAHAYALNCGMNDGMGLYPMSSSVTGRQRVDETDANGIWLWRGYDNDPAVRTEIWWAQSDNGRNSYALEWTDNFYNPDAGPVQYCNDNLPTHWTAAVNEWSNPQGQHRWFRATDLAGHSTLWRWSGTRVIYGSGRNTPGSFSNSRAK